MQALIKFFLTKSRLNYVAFLFVFLLGIISYQNIPKEVLPPIKIDKINISGAYSGASIDTLNKIAVTNYEKEFKSLIGVKKVTAFIKNGSFSMTLTLEKGLDKYNLLNKVKDIISNNRGDLPSDMDEPTASIVDSSFPLLDITLSSNKKTHDELIASADKLKASLSTIQNISKVELYESTKRVYEIVLDNDIIELYSLNKNILQEQIRQMSYTFPIGKIEDKKGHLYLSSKNGAKSVQELLDTLVKINNKSIYIRDIAKAKRKYEETDIISFLNGEKNIQLGVYKNDQANAILLSKQIKQKLEKFNENNKDLTAQTFYDSSIVIKKRLNTVISGIMFGLLLVCIAIYLLINKRVAFIVVLGIPTAILMGVVFLSFTPYTINIVTLIGALLVLGILVDDAIIIAENIQRHISLGEDKLQSAILGVKEVLVPVCASSLTTIFAFIPMMMLSGELGEFLKMIPIVVVVLIIASLIESFVFLPLHALHVLNKDDKELDWTKANELYKKCLLAVLKYKKSFIFGFSIGATLITIYLISSMRYQMFPDFDGSRFYISGEFDVNHTVEEVKKKTQEIEKKLLEKKNEFGLKTVSYTLGLRTSKGYGEVKPTVFEFTIEAYDRVPQNFVDAYITPLLSFEEQESRIREQSMDEVTLYFSKLFKEFKPKGLVDFTVKKEGTGLVENDIEIFLATKNKALLLESIEKLKKEISSMKGILFVDDTAKKGVKELKIEINEYGESLGFNETNVAMLLSSSYLKSTQTKGLDEEGIIEFVTYYKEKDSFEDFEDFEIQIPNTNKVISLNEIASFNYLENFDSIYKKNGLKVKSVIADVNNDLITATEVLAKLEKTFEELEKNDVNIIFGGEQEKNEQMEKELSFAFFIAIFLIFLTLLAMFESFKSTFLILSLIPFSITGAVFGHIILGLNLTLTSLVGMLGLAGVAVNDAIVMLDFIRKSESLEELIQRATLRLRPIIITSVTTFLGLSTLIFFATGQSKLLQPLATSLGFGLIWGTILTLLFLPSLYAVLNKNISKDNLHE